MQKGSLGGVRRIVYLVAKRDVACLFSHFCRDWKNLTVHPAVNDFKILFYFLRLLECKRLIVSRFDGGVSEQGDLQTGSFQRMV